MTAEIAGGARAASWSERGATFIVFLTLGIGIGAWAAALPALKVKLDLSNQGLSLALFALAIGSVFSTMAAGVIGPRFGTGRATGVAAFGVVLALMLPPLAGSLWQFVGLAFVVGLSTGTLEVVMNGHAGHIEQRWNGPIMSSFHGAFSLGGLAGAGFGGLLAASGWSVAGQLWIPVGLAALLDLVALPALGHGQPRRQGGLTLAWPTRATYALCVIVLFCFIIEGAMADWSAVYLSSVGGSTVAVAATGYAAFSICMAGGRFIGDRIVAILGPRRVVAGGGVLAMLGLGLAVACPGAVTASLGFAMVGIGLSNVAPVAYSAAARTGTSVASGIATVATVGFVGFLSGPPLIGGIASVAGLRVAIGCLVLAGGAVALLGVSTVPSRARKNPGRP